MEIEVFVDADPFVDEPQERYRAVSAFFTYVSLSKEGKPLPVPQLLVSSQGWCWGLCCFLTAQCYRSALLQAWELSGRLFIKHQIFSIFGLFM